MKDLELRRLNDRDVHSRSQGYEKAGTCAVIQL